MNLITTGARRRITLRWAGGIVGAAGLTAAMALAVQRPHSDAHGAVAGTPVASLTVEAVTPRPVTLARTVAASGSVSARDELIVGSDTSGVRLTDVLVEVGTQVKRGQLLARGDDSALRTQLAQQEALIRQAEAEQAQALANLARAEQVKDAGVYSTEAIQTRRTAADTASARLELAKAQRRELEVQLSRTRVTAPADGVIAKRSATVGAVMQPGLELFRLIRDEQLEWLAELPATALAQVQPGAKARVQLDDGRAIEASVRLVAPTLDPHTRNGFVHVELPRGVALKAGGHASGEIVVGEASVLTLPESVIFVRDGENFVYVLERDAVARRQRVDTGTRQHGLVEVRGLASGARVVSTGSGFVKDGERVQVGAPAVTQQGVQS